MQPQTALALNIAFAVLLLAAIADPRIRKDFLRVKGLALPAGLYGLSLAVCLWSLTPYVPGGPHPIWEYVGVSPGAGTVDKSVTLLECVKLLGLGGIFLVGVAAGSNDDRAKLAVKVVLGLGLAFGAWAFFWFVTGAGADGRLARLEASFENPNASATFFGCLLVIYAAWAVRTLRSAPAKAKLNTSLYLAGGALVLAACLLLTASRAGFVSTLVGLVGFGLLMLIFGKVRLGKAALLTLAAVAIVVIVVFGVGEVLVTRGMDTSQDFDVRLRIFEPHWQAFLRSPLMGYGLGTFDVVNRTLITPQNFSVLWDVRAVHNVYLEWLEQVGLLGAIPMFSAIAMVMFTTLRRAAQRRRMTVLLYGLLASSLVFLAHGLTDFALEMYSLASFWAFVLGLQFSLAQGSAAR